MISALLIAISIALGTAAISVIARSDCGVLGCFEPGVEGEIWQSQSPWGSIQTRTPGVPFIYEGEQVDGPNGPLTISEFGDYATELANLAEGECTFSHDADPLDETRQCKIGGNIVPPPLGKLMYPFSLAVDGTRVYVSDQYNHRVQAFDYDGTVVPLAHPIGNGEPGIGQYTVASTGQTGQKLRVPEGIAVDAAGRILVADSYNSRIAIFNNDGTVAFGTEGAPISKAVVDGVAEEPTTPAGLAVSPGTTVLSPGTAVDPDDDRRIVVSDRDQCFVYIYDIGFNLRHQVPSELPVGHAQGACVYPGGGPVPAGVFGSATGVAIDTANRIYVADYDNSRITILDPHGEVLGTFGAPPAVGIPGPEALQAPWGVMIDHHGRVVVTDSDNQRISFYSMTFDEDDVEPLNPPVATYLFQLNAGGTLNGFPTGIAEQVGAEEDGLDPAGRILTADTQHHRIQRFALPDLAIASGAAGGGIGTFEVVVPAGKPEVLGVSATVVPVEGGVTVDSITALVPAHPTSNDIGAAQTVKYQFTYLTALSVVHFRLNASGNGGNTEADEVIVEAAAPCGDCGATHVVNEHPIVGPVTPATPTVVSGDTWYDQRVFVRVTPTGTDTVTDIGWFVTGQAVADHGGFIHVTPVDGGTAYADITFTRAGLSVLSYWAIAADGTKSARVTLPIRVDVDPPSIAFGDWTPPSGVDGAVIWNNGNVSANYVVADSHSGTLTPDGTVAFWEERRNQAITVPVAGPAVDNVGHTATASSGSSAVGGRLVNIDRTKPVITAPANLTLTANHPGGAVIPSGDFDATASDPVLSGDGSPGSGVVLITNPGTFVFPVGTTTWQFAATDAAGNTETVQRTVTVEAPASSIASPNASVQYGQTLNVSATVTPGFATGSVTFTLGARTAVATISGGVATASFSQVVDSVGTHTLQVDYAGAGSVPAASTTAQITVTPVAITVTAAAKSKVYGNGDPALTYTVSGTLVGTDTFSGALTRAAGEDVGGYAIQQGTLALSGNYLLTFVGNTLSITQRVLTVTADPQTKFVNTPDPVFTYSITSGSKLEGDLFSGALSRVAGETSGTYAILIGSLTLGPNYHINFVGANLLINTVAIHVTANPMSKFYGDPDPVLSFTWTGPVTIDMFTGALDREDGEVANNYAITRGNLALPDGYVIFFHANTFSIQKRPATVTVNAASKIYGAANPAFSAVVAGTVGTDTLSYSISTPATVSSGVGGYPINVTVAAHPNYQVTGVHGELTIAPRPATVTANPKSKVYGSPNPAFDATVTGTVLGDTLAYSLTTLATLTSGAGNHAITVELGTNPNYAVTPVHGVLNITPKAATVAANPKTKAYGAALPPFDATVTGTIFGDTLNYTLSTTATALSAVGVYPITVELGANPNYTLTTTSSTLTVGAATITITANAKSKVYGAPNPALDAVVSGILGEAVNYTLSTTATPLSGVGSYPITVEPGLNPNYIVNVVNSTLTVGPKPVTVTADAISKVYGAAEPALTYTTNTPLVGEDGFFGSLARAAGTNVGSYAIGQGTLALGANYTLSFVGANFTITQAPATVTAGSGSKVYGTADTPIGASGSGFLPDDGITFTATRAAGENVATYATTATAAGTGIGNYAITYVAGSFSITPAAATVTASNDSKIYGAANPVFTAVVTGAVGTDTISYSLSSPATQASGVGNYAIVVTLNANPNYNVTPVNGTLFVSPRPITAVATPNGKTYGDADPAVLGFAVLGGPLVGMDGFLGALTRASGETVGGYAITQGTLSLSSNYLLSFVGSTFTIAPRSATVTANDAQKSVGGTDPALTVSSSGFLPADNITVSATRASGELVGTYVITPAAAGAALGNYAVTYVTGVFTILANQPPVCTAAIGGEIWPPNHKRFYAATVAGVTDPEGGALTILITGIWQDEVIDSTGDGKFSPDGQGVGTATAWVRAERNGHGNKAKGNGRVYEILFSATDNAGLKCDGSVLWTVPHNQGQGATAIDSGVRYDSTGVIPGAKNKSQIHQNSPQP